MKIFQVELFKKMAKARIPSSFHNGHATRKPSSWSYPTGEIDLNHTLTSTLSLHVLRPLLPAAGGAKQIRVPISCSWFERSAQGLSRSSPCRSSGSEATLCRDYFIVLFT